MKRTYTMEDLEKIDNHMMNYTLDLKVYGCARTTLKVHIGLKGNHAEIVRRLVQENYGKHAEILRARIVGREWTTRRK